MSRLLNLSFAAVLVACPPAASASQGAPEIIVNAQQAGVLDARGWTDAQSEAGQFSARFPCLFDDYVSTSPDQAQMRLHWLKCDREDGVRFAIVRPTGLNAETARSAFDSTAQDARFRAIEFKGMPAYSYATMADGRCARTLLVWTGKDTIMAIAERLEGDANCLGVLADANTFIDTLEVER